VFIQEVIQSPVLDITLFIFDIALLHIKTPWSLIHISPRKVLKAGFKPVQYDPMYPKCIFGIRHPYSQCQHLWLLQEQLRRV
jgi:hypothetical protein